MQLSSEAGLTLMSVMATVGLFGVLIVAGAGMLKRYADQRSHLDIKDRVDDVHSYIRNSMSCLRTLQDQKAACLAGEYVTVRDHVARTLITMPPTVKRYGKNVELRARCQVDDGFYTLAVEYDRRRDGHILNDRLTTNKALDWSSLTNGVPLACPCVAMPPSGLPDVPPAGPYPGLVRTTFYFAKEAFTPARAGVGAMALTTFRLPSMMLADLILNQQVKLVEFTAFTHQFKSGLDRVGIDFSSGGVNWTSNSPSNIYSSFGYLQISDIRLDRGILRGTVAIHTFGYLSGGSTLSLGSGHDGTNFIRPVAKTVPPSKVFTDIDLSAIVVKIRLYADSYDSVQYRALRVNLWAKTIVPLPTACPL